MAGSQCSSLILGCAQQLIDRVVAGRHFDSLRCRSGGEQRGHRIRLSPVLPVRINAGGDGEQQWRATTRIDRIHVRTTSNQLTDDIVMRPPSRDVQRGRVAGNAKVRIAVGPERVDWDAEVKEDTDTLEIRRSSKAGQQGSAK